jgi:hypothetical protein
MPFSSDLKKLNQMEGASHPRGNKTAPFPNELTKPCNGSHVNFNYSTTSVET